MERDTWGRLENLFFEAIELPEAERDAFIRRSCGGDEALERELHAIVAAHLSVGGTSDTNRLLSPSSLSAGATLPAGTRIGAYLVEELIGQGGMGEVYRGRRADAQYEQEVAVKVMRSGRDAGELMRRFRNERQILARLQHPGIATLLDGGVLDSGRPFLVMQFVDGMPITEYARRRELDLDARLGLFLSVCEAVRFAHANLVVHRDLKPSNILVTPGGEVRLLDFGIAKLLDSDSTVTATGDLLLLTPEHAAPEQFLGGSITTATDVYALGVLLYELLSGTRPYQSVPAVELHRAVCEKDPPRPSVAAADPDRLALARLERPPVPPRAVAGDLDSIVLKAMRKEPDRRFATVADLADDVRRHLRGFPVHARPETLRYVAGRFVRRNRFAVAAGAALVVALVSLAIVSVRFALASRDATRAIALERDVALQVSGFLEGLFKSPDPFAVGNERRDTMRMRDFLAEAASKVRQDLGDRPDLQARLLTVLGRAHTDIGESVAAVPLLEEARAIRQRTNGPRAVETANTELALGLALWQAGEPRKAEPILRAAESSLAALPKPTEDLSKVVDALGNALHEQGRLVDAESTYRRALAITEALPNPDPQRVAGVLNNLGVVLRLLARLPESDSLLTRALDIQIRAVGREHPRYAGALIGLAATRVDEGQVDGAIALYREALTIMRARVPESSPRLPVAINNLATALYAKAEYAEAETLLKESVALRERYGDTPIRLASTYTNLASVVGRLHGRAAELPIQYRAMAIMDSAGYREHPLTAAIYNNIGVSQHLLDRHREAVSSYRETLAIRRKVLPPNHPLTANALNKLAQCLLDLGDRTEAEPLLLEAYRMLEPRRNTDRQWNTTIEQLARYYRAIGKKAEAERYEAQREEPAGARPGQ
ncbi:MAG: tetratricopeptide repeat protein [Gemmatimonadales bacterium]